MSYLGLAMLELPPLDPRIYNPNDRRTLEDLRITRNNGTHQNGVHPNGTRASITPYGYVAKAKATSRQVTSPGTPVVDIQTPSYIRLAMLRLKSGRRR
jgi:hypothetical protein